jgi:hypothetical protein
MSEEPAYRRRLRERPEAGPLSECQHIAKAAARRSG